VLAGWLAGKARKTKSNIKSKVFCSNGKLQSFAERRKAANEKFCDFKTKKSEETTSNKEKWEKHFSNQVERNFLRFEGKTFISLPALRKEKLQVFLFYSIIKSFQFSLKKCK